MIPKLMFVEKPLRSCGCELARQTGRTLFDAFYRDELARHRQWACDLAETFSGTEILPLLLQLSFDLDGHVRKAASRAARTLSSRE
jgi:hypothetical protein